MFKFTSFKKLTSVVFGKATVVVLLLLNSVNVIFAQTPPVATISGLSTGCSGKEYVFTSNGTREHVAYVWTVTNGTIVWGQGTNEIGATFTQSGTVSVKFKDQDGVESNVATYSVTIDNAPVFDPFTASSLCSGELMEASLSGYGVAGDYTGTPYWTLDGVTITPGTYHVKDADNGKALRYNVSTANCGVVSSAPVSIVVKNKPTIVDVIGLPESLCLGSQVNATVKAVHNGEQPLSYQWMLNGTEIGNADNLIYTPVLADHGGIVTVNVSNECGTTTTQHAVVISGNQTTSANSSLAQAIDLPNGYFTRASDAANIEEMQLPDKYWENQNYLFCTTDNVTYSDGAKIWFNRTSVDDQWIHSTTGVGYEFTVKIVTNDYNDIHTFIQQQFTTILIDNGTYEMTKMPFPMYDAVCIVGNSDSGVKIFGLGEVVLVNKSQGNKLVNISGITDNVVENIIIDGDNREYVDYFLTIREEDSWGFKNDNLILKDITVRNAISKVSTFSSNRSVVAFLGMNNRPGKTQKTFARVHNMTIEASCKTAGSALVAANGAMQIYLSSNLYFKNLDIRYIPTRISENPLQVTVGSPSLPATDIVFDGLNLTADSILVQQFIPHDLAFSDDYRYVRYQASSSQKLFKTMPGYYNSSNIVYDKQEGYWIIPSDGMTTSRFSALKTFYTNFKSNNNNSLNGAPLPNIKLVANASGEIGNGFTVPDFGIDAQVNIVAVKNASDPAAQSSKVVFNSPTKISFNTAGASKVNLYNIDFDKNAKYTLPTIQDSIANSKAGNFYNCVFSTYGNDEEMKISIANAAFDFADVTSELTFDLKDLVLASGDTTGLILKYYDMNDVELQSTIVSTLGMTSYKVVGTHPKGCSYTDIVNVTIVIPQVRILKDLEDAIVCIGGTHTWSIEAEGYGLTYEWYCGFNRIPGANTNSITISDAKLTDYERYYVVVRSDYNGSRSSVYSKRVKLWVADYLPGNLKFAEYPNPATVGTTYHIKVDGYPDVTKYTWAYSQEEVSFSPEIGEETENETWATFGTLSVGSGTLKVTMDHPCGSREVTQTITVQYPTGVEDVTSTVVTVYPNPTSGVLKVLNTTSNQEMRVMDVTGSLKGTYKTQEGTTTIDLTGYAKGTYMVQYNGKTYKVIKK